MPMRIPQTPRELYELARAEKQSWSRRMKIAELLSNAFGDADGADQMELIQEALDGTPLSVAVLLRAVELGLVIFIDEAGREETRWDWVMQMTADVVRNAEANARFGLPEHLFDKEGDDGEVQGENHGNANL